jgi:PST family polysaccharide transporter
MAVGGMGVWSLAVQSVLSTAIVTTLTWKLSEWRPQARFSWTAVRELLPFSRNVVAFSTVNYWLRNADNLLVGRWLGSAALGIYGRAYSLMLLPLTLISATIGKVMFPALAAIQDDRPRVARVYLRMTRAIALITFPLMIGLLSVADSFVVALYGQQWSAMIPIVKVFCVVGMVQSISALNGSLYLSQGRADLQLRVGLVLSVIGIGAIVLGLKWGALGVAVCYGIYSVGSALPGIRIAVSLVGLGITDVLKSVAEVFAYAAAMGAAVYSLGLVLPAEWPHWVDLLLRTAFGVLVYGALLFGFRPSAFVDVRDAIRQQFGYGNSLELPFVGAK